MFSNIMSQPVLLTGDRPTGRLHLGHYVGSLMSRLACQHTHQTYIMIADVQALTDHFEEPEKVQHNILEVARDYMAVGLDPNACTFFVQSAIQEIAELSVYYLNLVTVARLERNPTVKSEIQQKGMEVSLPAGFLCYPIHQAADITVVRADVVPVGEDQLPIIEQTNEIVRRFNRIYNTDVLKEVQPILSRTTRLVGIDGQAKASKSLNNTIFLADSPEDIKQKIWQMYTDPHHLRVSDPGRVEGNVVFTYLDAFHADPEEVQALKDHYIRGGLGDTTIKGILNETLQALLQPIRGRRAQVNERELRNILADGTEKARQVASKTLDKVRAAMFIGAWR